MKLIMAKSLAGHDKNHIYIVFKEENNLLYLVNGKTKLLDKPKRKKKMHVQIIKHFPEEIQTKVEHINKLDDDTVREIVDAYMKYISS